MYEVKYQVPEPGTRIHVDQWVDVPTSPGLMTTIVTATDKQGRSRCVVAQVRRHFDLDGTQAIENLQAAANEALAKLEQLG